MNYTYRLLEVTEQTITPGVLRIEDGLGIPMNPENRHYQEYLEWRAEGNTPLPADNAVTWDTIRAKRSQLIRDSDWTMTPGATVDQAQWSAYRQILRDLPQTYSNPEDVVGYLQFICCRTSFHFL